MNSLRKSLFTVQTRNMLELVALLVRNTATSTNTMKYLAYYKCKYLNVRADVSRDWDAMRCVSMPRSLSLISYFIHSDRDEME